MSNPIVIPIEAETISTVYPTAATVQPQQPFQPPVPALLACSWYQSPNPASPGSCSFSPMRTAQSLFALPSKVVEPALLSLPAGLVPMVGLAVNLGAWWLVWKGVEKWVLGPRVGR